MNFTDNQKKIIKQTEGPVLVIACPGSGKTTTVIGRVNYMVKEKKIDPFNILVVTFTKNAAEEMQERYEKYENAIPGVVFSTIHSLCFNVLKERYNFSFANIIKVYEQYKFFAEVMEGKVNPRDIEDTIKLLLNKISCVRNADIPYTEAKIPEFDKNDFKYYYEKYESYKKKINKVDFDDMLIMCRDLFVSEKETLSIWQKRFPYIIIDEYQDTNKIQSDIFSMIAEITKNICVVGDDDQSIYGFRSADSSIMLNFEKQYNKCKRFDLDTNYRSTSEIIGFASNLIQNNKIRFDKKFKGFKKETGSIKFCFEEDLFHELNGVMQHIEELAEKGVPYDDIAILYRNNKHALPFVGRFMLMNIPFYIKEPPQNIFKDIVFTDIKSYYNLAFKQGSNEDYLKVLNHPSRFLKRDVFSEVDFSDCEDALQACNNCKNPKWAKQNLLSFFDDIKFMKEEKPKKFFDKVIKIEYLKWLKSDYAEFSKRGANNLEDMFEQLREDALNYNSMEEWIAHGNEMLEELNKKEKEKSGITLSTFHGSKGLEWNYVFIVNANKGVVPSKYAETEVEIEEERRSFYVAATRAKESLYIYTSELEESPFISDKKETENKKENSKNVNEMDDKLKSFMKKAICII